MKNRLLGLLGAIGIICTISGCDTGSTPTAEEPANQYVGTWVAIHINQSTYTDPVYMPVPVKKLTHTLRIHNDGSYTDSIIAEFTDDSTMTGSYSGFYEFTDNYITFTETAGEINGEPVIDSHLDSHLYLLTGNTLIEQDSNSAESPEEDADGKPLYPIILTYYKK
jgi:hypothetical protein